MSEASACVRVGFDIGGTFTDVTIIDGAGRLHATKVLSRIDDLGDDIARCIFEVGGEARVSGFVHGTTIASNAVIEGTAASTGLLTTRGFRDELEMRGQRRPNIYDVDWNRLPPLVPRHLRLEVDERMLADGRVDRPLDEAVAEQAIVSLRDAGVEAIAICLINAYLNPVHEHKLAELVTRLAPELTVCLSSEVHPEIREYERASTTVINASLVPVVSDYLDRLEGRLSTFSDRLLIMQSNGGILSSHTARQRPAVMIESGPAAGVLAASRLANENGWDAVLSFDMGGTTAKACLIENGVPLERPGGEVGAAVTSSSRLFGGGGHVLRFPWLDIVEVGAGGGSIAWVEEGGALRVGPQSAGASPGPACYGQGGDLPTVTDANLVLGYMNPQSIADDTLALDRKAANIAIRKHVADPLGLDLMEAAYGVLQVVNATMMRALRAVSTERGRDPRAFTLIPFGGAGPMHAASLAEAVGIADIRIPPFSGLFSSLGLLLADYRHDYVRSVAVATDKVALASVGLALEELEHEALTELSAQGVSAEAVEFVRQADMRYAYQVSETAVPLPELDEHFVANLVAAFTAAHFREFGYERDDVMELVNIRLRATAPAATVRFDELAGVKGAAASGATALRKAYFGPANGLCTAAVLGRNDIDHPVPGPAIVEEPDTTVVIPPGWSVERDRGDNLRLRKLSV